MSAVAIPSPSMGLCRSARTRSPPRMLDTARDWKMPLMAATTISQLAVWNTRRSSRAYCE